MSEDKRAFVHRLFATIASRYDLFNQITSFGMDRRWRQLAVDRCALQPGMRVLDLCTGTGDLALISAAALRGAAADSWQVVGLDLCAPMLRVAGHKAQRQSARIAWLFGDALALPFGDGRFDRIVIGFSTRNLANLSWALQEMHRVLAPHGRLVILETGKPQSPLVRAGYYLYLRTVVIGVGFALFGKTWPFTYLQRSIAHFWEPHEFTRALRDVGFASAHHLSLGGGIASLFVAVKA